MSQFINKQSLVPVSAQLSICGESNAVQRPLTPSVSFWSYRALVDSFCDVSHGPRRYTSCNRSRRHSMV
jgi:hypothetical protein